MIDTRFRFLLLAAPVLAMVAVLPAMPAAAQSLGSSRGIQPAVKFDKGDQAKPHAAPPPALPGSQANPPGATPADKNAADLQPNDALFDAINRGDVTAARDAISRGADPGARNVLGMSPLELSVDLGRNDISFLLLALRGENGSDQPSAQQAAAQAAPPARLTAAQRRAEQRAERQANARSQQAVSVRAARATAALPQDDAVPAQPAAAMATTQRAKLFAGNGGAPNPGAGFLGFDTQR